MFVSELGVAESVLGTRSLRARKFYHRAHRGRAPWAARFLVETAAIFESAPAERLSGALRLSRAASLPSEPEAAEPYPACAARRHRGAAIGPIGFVRPTPNR